jgi:hypothetical protein
MLLKLGLVVLVASWVVAALAVMFAMPPRR